VTVEGLAGNLLAGLALALLIEAYLRLRARFVQRRLRRLLGFPLGASMGVISPARATAADEASLSTSSAYALSYCLTLCTRAGYRAVLSSAESVAPDLPPSFIAIGGPTVNKVTAALLRTYCPGFSIVGSMQSGDPVGGMHYRVAGRTFEDTQDSGYAFVVRVGPNVTGGRGVMILVWGHTGFATAAAAHELGALDLPATSSFFVALAITKHVGHQAAAGQLEDLSASAFGWAPV